MWNDRSTLLVHRTGGTHHTAAFSTSKQHYGGALSRTPNKEAAFNARPFTAHSGTPQPTTSRNCYRAPLAADMNTEVAAPRQPPPGSFRLSTYRESTTPTSRKSANLTPAVSAARSFMTQASRDAEDYTCYAPQRHSTGPSMVSRTFHAAGLGEMPKPPPLPYKSYAHRHRHMLVLDLDETLVHASVQCVEHDFTIFVDIDGRDVEIFVRMRPYVREFLQIVSRLYEVTVFTASLEKYAGKVIDMLDPHRTIFSHRLYRERCTEVEGSYIKDLSLLGRDMNRVMIIDNTPNAYRFQPQNAIPIVSFFDDPDDTHLLKALPMLEEAARSATPLQVLRKHLH